MNETKCGGDNSGDTKLVAEILVGMRRYVSRLGGEGGWNIGEVEGMDDRILSSGDGSVD